MHSDNKLYVTIELGNCISGISDITIVFSFDNARDMVNAKRILDVKKYKNSICKVIEKKSVKNYLIAWKKMEFIIHSLILMEVNYGRKDVCN